MDNLKTTIKKLEETNEKANQCYEFCTKLEKYASSLEKNSILEACLSQLQTNIYSIIYNNDKLIKGLNTELESYEKSMEEFAEELHAREQAELENDIDNDDIPF